MQPKIIRMYKHGDLDSRWIALSDKGELYLLDTNPYLEGYQGDGSRNKVTFRKLELVEGDENMHLE